MSFSLRSRFPVSAAAAGLALCAASAFVAGCANPERSRNLDDPSVAPVVIARQVCSNCHGVTGSTISPNFPNLAGQPAQYLQAQLREYRGHSRQDPAGFEYMWGLSRKLTDAQIDGLGEYFAGQKLAAQPPETPPERHAAGQAIFEQGLPDKGVPACSGCHGASGEGHDTFPRLAGQHADYIVKQLQVFQRTDERPQGAVMKVVAHGLDSQAMHDVAGYLQSLASR